ncbi:MAG: DUF1573 domain-containing protein [Bacteroidales bacterium]
MKYGKVNHIFTFLLVLFITGCSHHRTENTKEIAIPDTSHALPYITFEQQAIDLGRIVEGETAGVTFHFKNTGKANLIIKDVQASCGCTIPKWDKEPVPSDEEGSIQVFFNTTGRTGLQNKSIRIISNAANNEVILAVTAEVIPQN